MKEKPSLLSGERGSTVVQFRRSNIEDQKPISGNGIGLKLSQETTGSKTNNISFLQEFRIKKQKETADTYLDKFIEDKGINLTEFKKVRAIAEEVPELQEPGLRAEVEGQLISMLESMPKESANALLGLANQYQDATISWLRKFATNIKKSKTQAGKQPTVTTLKKYVARFEKSRSQFKQAA